MPYILKDRRKIYDRLIKKIAFKVANENIANCTSFCGDWNYIITKLLKETIKESNERKCYALMNEVIGMLESCKLEWYRREVAPYEDEKIVANGDVK